MRRLFTSARNKLLAAVFRLWILLVSIPLAHANHATSGTVTTAHSLQILVKVLVLVAGTSVQPVLVLNQLCVCQKTLFIGLSQIILTLLQTGIANESSRDIVLKSCA